MVNLGIAMAKIVLLHLSAPFYLTWCKNPFNSILNPLITVSAEFHLIKLIFLEIFAQTCFWQFCVRQHQREVFLTAFIHSWIINHIFSKSFFFYTSTASRNIYFSMCPPPVLELFVEEYKIFMQFFVKKWCRIREI